MQSERDDDDDDDDDDDNNKKEYWRSKECAKKPQYTYADFSKALKTVSSFLALLSNYISLMDENTTNTERMFTQICTRLSLLQEKKKQIMINEKKSQIKKKQIYKSKQKHLKRQREYSINEKYWLITFE